MSAEHWGPGDVSGALGAYESAPAVMLAFEGEIGEDLVLASANDAARSALGELCEYGRRASEMTPGVDNGTRLLMHEMVDTAVTTGRSVTRPGHCVRVDEPGRPLLEVFWDLTVSPWFADDGSVRGVLAHGMDVTERARARRREVDALHDVVAMQDSLLPDWLPVLPGVDVSGRYLMAHRESEAGGDWYDAMPLPDGRVALVVGDTPCHGLAAAAAMGRLRAVTQERLTSGAGLEATMSALDRFACSVTEAHATTMCVVLLDPITGRLEYCTAGHPPPLVVRPGDGQARHLAQSGAAPLATTNQMAVSEDHVDPGDLVVLYTDGLLSRPERSPAASTVELGQIVADVGVGPLDPEGRSLADLVCARALEELTRTTGYDDDIAVLVAGVTEPIAPIRLALAADGQALPRILDSLATWLESIHVRDLDHLVVQLAVDELVTNVVEHAYPPEVDSRSIAVTARLLGIGDLELKVTDRGRWIASEGQRGRGLAMVKGLVDRLVIDRSEQGTVATIRHRLSRPAHLLTGTPTVAALSADDSDVPFRLVVDDGCLQLLGALDRAGAHHLKATLDERAIDEHLVIDMSGLTRLPSAAVQVLHLACRDAASQRRELVLFAPPGTPAQHVLELVRLPYTLTPPGLDS